MVTWRSAEPSSAGCLDLAKCVRTNRKTLAPKQKQLSAEVRRRAVVSEVGATGFEPATSWSRTNNQYNEIPRKQGQSDKRPVRLHRCLHQQAGIRASRLSCRARRRLAGTFAGRPGSARRLA